MRTDFGKLAATDGLVLLSELVSVESLEEPSPSEPSLLSTTRFLLHWLAATTLMLLLLDEVFKTLLSFRSAPPLTIEICLGAGSGAFRTGSLLLAQLTLLLACCCC